MSPAKYPLRRLIGALVTAEHDRAILAEALQFLLRGEASGTSASIRIIRKLDAVALKGEPPKDGSGAAPWTRFRSSECGDGDDAS